MYRRLALISIFAALQFVAPTGLVSAGGGGGCRALPVTEATKPSVVLEGACFTPTIVRIDPGETVTFVNQDPFRHVITGAHTRWGSYEDIQPKQSLGYTFDDPGIYPYSCYLHPGMTGAVVVGDADSPVGKAVVTEAKPASSEGKDGVEAREADDVLTSQSTEGGGSDWRTGAAAAMALPALGLGIFVGRRRRGRNAGNHPPIS